MKGTLLNNRYLLQEPLGTGGMGEVFRAVDARTRQTVAVKVLFGDAHADPQLVRNLSHEVRTVARLHHRYVVRLVDFGLSAQRRPFLVMEYIPGKGLDRWFDLLSCRELLALADQTLEALGYAHARGVVHRDLKPENILVIEGEDGVLEPRLVDFGIAQVADMEALLEGESASVLHAQRVLGTPQYMAPEQARGLAREVGRASDLYALGVVLYQFVAGRVPFQADSVIATILMQAADPPPPLVARAGVIMPDGFDDTVMRLLAKRPQDRYAFAADVRRALRELDWQQARDEPVEQPQAPTWSRSRAALPRTDVPAAPVAWQVSSRRRVPPLLGESEPAGRVGATALSAGLFGMREVPVVGRAAERAALWSHVEATLREQSVRAVVLSGPAGIGKSRLARWLAERAEEEGMAQLIGCGIGPGAVLPRGGLRGLMERHAGVDGLSRADARKLLQSRLVTPGVLDAAELDPLLDYLRPSEDIAALMTGRAIEPIGMAARLVRGAADKRPVVLWLDDVTGADATAFLELLDLLLASRTYAPFPVLVVVTVDEGGAGNGDPALSELRALAGASGLSGLAADEADGNEQGNREQSAQEGVEWFVLGPLGNEDVARLARAMLPLDDAAADAVALECHGVASYVAHLLTHWTQAGTLLEDDRTGQRVLVAGGSTGQAVVGLWVTRLAGFLTRAEAGVSAARRELVGLAALCGQHFDAAVLRDALARASRTDLLERFDEIWDGFIAEDLWLPVALGQARFAAAELRDHVLEILVEPAQAIRWHEALALAKQAVHADAPQRFHAEIAGHQRAAGRYREACETLLAAARQAQAWGRYTQAGAWLAEVRALLESQALPEAAALADQVDLGQALGGLRQGDYQATELALDALDARARPGVRQDTRHRAALMRAELARRRGKLDLSVHLYREAQSSFAAQQDPHGEAQALQGLAETLLLRVRYEDARNAAEKALRIHEASQQTLEMGRCLLVMAKIAALVHDERSAEELNDRAVRAFELAGAIHGAAEAGFNMMQLCIQTGRLDEALVRIDDLEERFIAVGDQAMIAACHRSRAKVHGIRGDLDGAERSSRKALDIAARIGDRLGMARAFNSLGEVARKRRDWAEARQHYRAYLTAATGLGDTLSVAIGTANLGLVHVQLGDWPAAAEAFAAAVEQMRKAGNRAFAGAFLGCLAHAWSECGRLDDASTALDEALTIDDELKLAEADFIMALEGYARRAFAAEPDRASRALEVALRRWQELGRTEDAERVRAAKARLAVGESPA